MRVGKHWRRKLVPSQVDALYVLYQRGLGVHELADLVWRRFGYASPNAARHSILRFFHEGGYEVRSRGEARRLAHAKRRAAA